MNSREDIISAIKAALIAQGIPKSNWAATLSEVTAHVSKETQSQTKQPLPNKARITYAERADDPKLAGLGIFDFLRAEYGPWLDGTMSRKILGQLDKSAYRALYNVEGPMPDDICLPIIREVNDRALATDKTRREVMRLASANARRKRAAKSRVL